MLKARTDEYSLAAKSASDNSLSSKLAGMHELIKQNNNKLIEFLFWVIALFTIELAAVCSKTFSISDADYALYEYSNQLINKSKNNIDWSDTIREYNTENIKQYAQQIACEELKAKSNYEMKKLQS